ncbi:MAG: tetratricopeptide repeat protein [Candidatus Gastranaerophilales bacterium]|nr:tetratricopeptide repeat protein [Candidatus Gastranaerophilales bacterium]
MKKIVINLILIAILFSGCSFSRNNSSKVAQNNNAIPTDAKFLLDKSIEEIRVGEIDGAIKDLQELTKSYPKLALGYYNLGLAYIKNNQRNEAIIAWEKTTRIDDKYADAYFNLGKAYKSFNKKKARDNLLKYLLLRPNDPYINNIKDEIFLLNDPAIGKGIIGRVSITDEVDLKNNIALSVKNFFKPNTPFIYSCIELVNATKDKNIEVNWFYIMQNNEKLPVNSTKFSGQGSKNVVISLKKPYIEWPSGKYEAVILVNGVENAAVPFIIQR